MIDPFVGITTSDPSAVAEAVANYMGLYRDTLTDDEVKQVYDRMVSYGVPDPRVLVGTTPMHLFGYPSMTG